MARRSLIMRVQLLGDAQGDFAGIGRQQLDDFDAVIHPSRGVDARPQTKPNLPGADFAGWNAGDLFERDDSGPRGGSQLQSDRA